MQLARLPPLENNTFQPIPRLPYEPFNYVQLRDMHATSEARARHIQPLAQFYRNLRNDHPSVLEVKAWLEGKLPSGVDYPAEETLFKLAKIFYTTSFPHQHTYKDLLHYSLGNWDLWQLKLDNMPSGLSTVGTAGDGFYTWAHATSQAGLLGILRYGLVLPTCKDTLEDSKWKLDYIPNGFFASATKRGINPGWY